jgi:hypothetical protein
MTKEQFTLVLLSLGLPLLGDASAAAATGPSVPGWRFTNLSGLLPDQPRFPATRHDRAPSAQAQGVVWLADNPMVSRISYFAGNAIAFWDRKGVSYLTPYPPDWSWTGVWEPSACRADVAFPLEGIWPPDAGPTDPHYIYSEMFYLDGEGLKRITCDQASQHVLPSLHEGKVAWQSCSAPDWTDDWEIYFWDGATTRRITDNTSQDTHASLYRNVVAWCSDGNIVYLSVPPAGQPGPLPPPVLVGPGEAPSLFKNKIAYHAFDGNDTEIFLFDILSAQTTQVTDNDLDDADPSLFEDTIAWQGFDGNLWQILYWDGKVIHQLTEGPWYDHVNPSLWGSGLNTTIAYTQGCSDCIPAGSRVVCARRGVLSVLPGPAPGETTITWPSLEGRAYRVQYSEDLVNWQVAADAVPSAGYGETSWTDGIASGTVPAPSEVSRRFYRVCEWAAE